MSKKNEDKFTPYAKSFKKEKSVEMHKKPFPVFILHIYLKVKKLLKT